MPQCETKEALEQIEDIVQIEGLDGIFIGPYDLSTCLGIPGQFDNPIFKQALDRILKACHDAGKLCYIFTGTTDQARDYVAQGYRRIAHNLDFNILIEAYKQVVTDIRK